MHIVSILSEWGGVKIGAWFSIEQGIERGGARWEGPFEILSFLRLSVDISADPPVWVVASSALSTQTAQVFRT